MHQSHFNYIQIIQRSNSIRFYAHKIQNASHHNTSFLQSEDGASTTLETRRSALIGRCLRDLQLWDLLLQFIFMKGFKVIEKRNKQDKIELGIIKVITT